MPYLFPWWEGQPDRVSYCSGQDALEGEGQERVKPEHKPVAVLADVTGYLETKQGEMIIYCQI